MYLFQVRFVITQKFPTEHSARVLVPSTRENTNNNSTTELHIVLSFTVSYQSTLKIVRLVEQQRHHVIETIHLTHAHTNKKYSEES